jgi:hypothetical protein
MRTPDPPTGLTTDTTSSAASMRRPTVASRSYVLAFGSGRSTLTPPSLPAHPALQDDTEDERRLRRREPPARQTHRLTTHCSFRDADLRSVEPLLIESSLCQGGALVGIGARRAGPR